MIQTLKITIRWRDAEGRVVGICRDTCIDFPEWGEKKYMREEINVLIAQLAINKEQLSDAPKTFTEFVMAAFSLDSICSIKSKTAGSYIHLKGDSLKQYIDNYKEHDHVG